MRKYHYNNSLRYNRERFWLVYHYDLDSVEDELLRDTLSFFEGAIIYREDRHNKLGTYKYPVMDFIELKYDWERKIFQQFCDEYYKFYMLSGIWDPVAFKESLRKEGKIK